METNKQTERLRQRIRRELMALIAQMDFTQSTRLPAEKKLAVDLQVSRSSLRSVLTELETEGKLVRRHGSGTYVDPEALTGRSPYSARLDLVALIEKNGFTAAVQTVDPKEVFAEERASKLGLLPSDHLLELRSVYSSDGRPCVYCIESMDVIRFPLSLWAEHGSENLSVPDFLQGADAELLRSEISLRASDSNRIPELRECFHVPKGAVKPVLRLEIVSFDRFDQPALLTNAYLDTDRIKLSLTRDLVR